MEHILVTLLALSCFISFVWAILCFFQRAGDLSISMQVLSLTGSVSIVWELVGLFLFSSAVWPRLAGATCLYALSLGLFWWAICANKERRLALAFSESRSAQLVQSGPYRWVRHPIYLSYMLAWIAGGCAIEPLWGWLPFPCMGVQYLLAIRHEERQFLSGELSVAYQAYRNRAGMLLPRLK